MPISFAVYQLRIAQEHDMIASLYTDLSDPDAFCSGFIEQVNSRHVLLAALTPWGFRDGWLLWRVADVRQVFTGDEYEARLEMLTKLRGETHTPLISEPPPPDADLLRWLLDWAREQAVTISILTSDESYTGRVILADDLRVTMETFDFFGVKNHRATVLLMRDVESVMIGTEEEKMYDLLSASPVIGITAPHRLEDGKEPT
ncbi:MAG: hypothetical protein LBS72_03845 [Oscillospiraceae bacterium]|jgi:hypothetical protein|nr:hypothetical protein [Oscillospiraceae bacterium]